MQKQSFKNHRRVHPLFHYLIAPVSLFAAIVSLALLSSGFSWINVLIGLAFLLIHLTAFIARDYAKKNQDRIIRAELRLRYFVLTQEDFGVVEAKLSMAQIVALRFAHDQDFIGIIKRHDLAALSPKQIKEGIRDWKADNTRV